MQRLGCEQLSILLRHPPPCPHGMSGPLPTTAPAQHAIMFSLTCGISWPSQLGVPRTIYHTTLSPFIFLDCSPTSAALGDKLSSNASSETYDMRRWVGHESGAFMSGVSILRKQAKGSSLTAPTR